MSEQRNVYGFCDDNCKFLVYTREEVLSLLQQAINDGTLQDIDAEYSAITQVIDNNGRNDVRFWVGTEAEFNSLDPKPAVERFIPRLDGNGLMYICIDDSSINNMPTQPLTAEEIKGICN